MSDDKPDNITEPAADTATEPVATSQTPEEQTQPDNKLTDLMAGGDAATDAKKEAAPAPNLEAEALRAAEQALAQGEKALADAQSELDTGAQPQTKPAPAPNRKRELALRALLAVNVLAMVVVAMLPGEKEEPTPSGTTPQPHVTPEPKVEARRFNEPWNKALDAAEKRDFASAVTILEGYLADNPRMAPSMKLNVLNTLAQYAGYNNDYRKASEFTRRASAIEQSHSLPEDLVAMAQAAVENNDHASLRRIWAQFLLQQRQIPTWLEKHVAQAYLQLGDSYRNEADTAQEAARQAELAATAARLREEALKESGK